MAEINVLHIRSGGFFGGPERQLLNHARQMHRTDYRLVIASFTENGCRPEFLDTIAADGQPVHHFETRSSYDYRAIPVVREYLKEHRIDIVCTHEYRSHVIGMMARRGTKARWVAFSRGWTRENLKVRLFQSLEKVLIRFADHVVAVSGAQRDYLRRLGVSASKLSVVHNAIDVTDLAGVEATDLRSRFDFPDDAIIVVAAGRFSSEKGQRLLVDAARMALADNDRLRFILYGAGPDLDDITRLIEQQDLGGRIICPGFARDFASCLKGANILVNPSLSEGMPNIVLEAMALSVPVVATAVGGVPELIIDKLDGLLVRYGSANLLAAAILRLADDPVFAGTLADEALRTVRDRFSFERQATELVEVYRRVAR